MGGMFFCVLSVKYYESKMICHATLRIILFKIFKCNNQNVDLCHKKAQCNSCYSELLT